jgi:hypothetical protein
LIVNIYRIDAEGENMTKVARTDASLELAVRYGIILDLELGAVSAWRYMTEYGVSSAVIMRVLLHRECRRKGDQVAVDIAERYRNSDRSREAIQAAFEVPLRTLSG